MIDKVTLSQRIIHRPIIIMDFLFIQHVVVLSGGVPVSPIRLWCPGKCLITGGVQAEENPDGSICPFLWCKYC